MKKIIVWVFLVIDAILIITLVFSLGQKFLFVPKKAKVSSKIPLEQKITVSPLPEKTTINPSTVEKETKGIKETKKRNIQFKHWAPQAKKVEIVGDFNNWIPEVMAKGENQHWIIDYQLEPGEYTYKFCVDGKLKKDPYNKRSVPDGYGGESSLLIVKPLGANSRE